jgi:tetratricopeptide (TPR) repeat protein
MTSSIQLKITLWLILICSNTLLITKNATAARLPQNGSFDRPMNVLADLAVELAATDNRQQALQLFDRAVELALALNEPTDKIAVLSDIAAKMTEVGENERASQLLERAVKFVPEDDYVGLSAIAVDIAKAGKTDRALQIFDRAVQLYQTFVKQQDPNEDPYYKEESLVSVVANIAKAGQTDRALQVTQTFSSPLRKAEALNEIATNLIDSGKLEEAREPLSQALELANKVNDTIYAYEANGSCANYKFALLSRIGTNLSVLAQLDRALKIATNIYNCYSANGEYKEEYQIWAFTGILSHLANVEQVKQTWSSASAVSDSSIWSAIALKLIEMGETDLALTIAEKIDAEVPSGTEFNYPFFSGAKEDELINIAFKLAEVGAIDLSEKIVDKIHEPLKKEVKALIAIPIAAKLDRENKTEEATALFSQSLQLSPIFVDPQVFDDYNSYKTKDIRRRIAIELSKIGRVERALAVAKTVNEEYWQRETLAQMALTLAQKGEIEPALEISQTIPDGLYWQKYEALAIIAPKLIELGRIDRGIELAKTSQSEEIQISVAHKLVKLRKIAEGEQILQSLPDESINKAKAMADFAVLLIQNGD